jgi:hypothetical protein
MSTSIRPPGGPAATGPAELEQLSEAQAGQQAGQTSSATREAAAASRAETAHGTEVESPAASVLAQLDRGEVTREQAIDALVIQALETHGGAALPAARRHELAAVLRSALLDDPALSRLLG